MQLRTTITESNAKSFDLSEQRHLNVFNILKHILNVFSIALPRSFKIYLKVSVVEKEGEMKKDGFSNDFQFSGSLSSFVQ